MAEVSEVRRPTPARPRDQVPEPQGGARLAPQGPPVAPLDDRGRRRRSAPDDEGDRVDLSTAEQESAPPSSPPSSTSRQGGRARGTAHRPVDLRI